MPPRRAPRRVSGGGQAEQIGIAITDFYPAIGVNGTVGFLAENIDKLFTSPALTGFIGPVFQWKLLNYGRIKHNVKTQQAKFQELVAAYQQTVIRANAEVEDGLVTFLRAQARQAIRPERGALEGSRQPRLEGLPARGCSISIASRSSSSASSSRWTCKLRHVVRLPRA